MFKIVRFPGRYFPELAARWLRDNEGAGTFFAMLPEKEIHIVNLKADVEYQELLSAEAQTNGMRSGLVRLEPGQSCGQHSTEAHEEMLVFLAGGGQIIIGNDGLYEMTENQVAYIPPRTLHDVKNTGQKPLAYIYCVAPVKRTSARRQ